MRTASGSAATSATWGTAGSDGGYSCVRSRVVCNKWLRIGDVSRTNKFGTMNTSSVDIRTLENFRGTLYIEVTSNKSDIGKCKAVESPGYIEIPGDGYK